MDLEFERSREQQEQQEQIDEVIREILDTGIPEDLQRLRTMIIILGRSSCIRNSRMNFAIWRLREDLIRIVTVYQSCNTKD